MNVHAFDTDTNTTLHTTGMAGRAPGAGAPDTADHLADSVPTNNQRLIGVWNGPEAVRHIYPYTLFNKSPLQLRRIGALGGKAHSRNQRARRALMPALPASVPLRNAPQQSTADAIAVLDARFPWLRCAEQRRGSTPSSRLMQTYSHRCVNHEAE
jgi:hypothetical protein